MTEPEETLLRPAAVLLELRVGEAELTVGDDTEPEPVEPAPTEEEGTANG